MSGLIRRLIIGGSVVMFVFAWLGVAVVHVSMDSTTAFVVAVTIAALATEALFWILAIIGGWAVFANRQKLWNRFFGQTSR